MKIDVIFTGGTIGSKKNENGMLSTNKDGQYTLLNRYIETFGNHVEFMAREPYCILSENLSAKELMILIEEIRELINLTNPNGIIITHGTDTLQYTAAILGYVFADINFPIILVSSNYILDDPRSNGLMNFKCAVNFIKERLGQGVFVSYQNIGQDVYIHRATRLEQSIMFKDNVYSVMDSWYGKFSGKNSDLYEKNPAYKTDSSSRKNIFSSKKIKLCFNSDSIIRIRPYPGMSYPLIMDHTKAIIHESYHSGTIRISDEFLDFVKQAKKEKIPFFLTGLDSKESKYETVAVYREVGIIPLPESAVIAQYCKLWLAVSNNLDVVEIMKYAWGEDFVYSEN